MTTFYHGRSAILFIIAILGLASGIIFTQQGSGKHVLIKRLAATEKVTAGLSGEEIMMGVGSFMVLTSIVTGIIGSCLWARPAT
mgnify:CR=1 FL=1